MKYDTFKSAMKEFKNYAETKIKNLFGFHCSKNIFTGECKLCVTYFIKDNSGRFKIKGEKYSKKWFFLNFKLDIFDLTFDLSKLKKIFDDKIEIKGIKKKLKELKNNTFFQGSNLTLETHNTIEKEETLENGRNI